VVVRFFATLVSRAARVRLAVLPVLLFATFSSVRGQQPSSLAQLVQQFESETVFWRQIEVAKAIVATHDKSILPRLESWLAHEDRHLRGNTAFIFAGLGDPRGFDVIEAILRDYSERPPGEGFGKPPRWSLREQIRQDRYYATHLLGDLKDPRAIPILVSLVTDPDVNYIVPWSLAQIGDRSAIPVLIESLRDQNPSIRVLAIYALVELKATEAVPRLRQMLGDHERSNFGKLESVADAARAAISKLQ
jgi:HEAT repeat protein